ncbi:MgtC/SapB family protein [Ralstonia pickettii]|uniref:MgtC/SapB family protein n=1 Tax=Ralstonia pickettii TaxID=329 RepID=UPI0015BD1FBF|nr:MgtC/SapB family protein [Ralstonia pickettii]NWK44541.1 MgtC/SapB family protein [Ralstonia pickettii]
MSSLLSFSVALGVGLAIGLERERSHAGSAELPAGMRTFAIAALAGAIAASLPIPLAVPTVLLAVALLAAVGYHHSANVDPGVTTELALVATTLLGAFAVSEPEMTAGLGTVLLVLLYAKAGLHRFARTVITQRELADLLILAVAALLIWPAVPDRNMGPLDAWNPHTLWLIVLLVMLMGNTGHFAARWFGERIGLPLAGLFSGFASSVATITAMAARVRKVHRPVEGAVAAALLSNVATLVQMLLLTAAINIDLLRVLAAPLAVGMMTTVAWSALWIWRGSKPLEEAPENSASSINWRVAIGFALWTATLLLAAAAARTWFGTAAVVAVTVVGAFADVHAATASIATQVAGHTLQSPTAGKLVMLALTVNTLSKVVVATSGGRAFSSKVTAGLLIMLLASWTVFWLVS